MDAWYPELEGDVSLARKGGGDISATTDILGLQGGEPRAVELNGEPAPFGY